MSKQPEVSIHFGYDGILYADTVKKKLKEKADLEARIEKKLMHLELRAHDHPDEQEKVDEDGRLQTERA